MSSWRTLDSKQAIWSFWQALLIWAIENSFKMMLIIWWRHRRFSPPTIKHEIRSPWNRTSVRGLVFESAWIHFKYLILLSDLVGTLLPALLWLEWSRLFVELERDISFEGLLLLLLLRAWAYLARLCGWWWWWPWWLCVVGFKWCWLWYKVLCGDWLRWRWWFNGVLLLSLCCWVRSLFKSAGLLRDWLK